jgi:hypothetical protein
MAVGDILYITVSLGQRVPFNMPTLTNLLLEDAQHIIANLPIDVTVTYTFTEIEGDSGVVLEQVPPAGAVIRDGYTIVLRISADPSEEYVSVPTVRGRAEAEAVALLEGAGLEVEIARETSNTFGAGVVISQEPEPGDVLERGETVYLRISTGPPAAPPPPPPPADPPPEPPPADPPTETPPEEPPPEEPPPPDLVTRSFAVNPIFPPGTEYVDLRINRNDGITFTVYFEERLPVTAFPRQFNVQGTGFHQFFIFIDGNPIGTQDVNFGD